MPKRWLDPEDRGLETTRRVGVGPKPPHKGRLVSGTGSAVGGLPMALA